MSGLDNQSAANLESNNLVALGTFQRLVIAVLLQGLSSRATQPHCFQPQ